jgi:hypothetical protein
MEAARRITDESWNEILTLGRAPLEDLGAACTALDASATG